MRRLLSTMLIFALLALAGYNAFQVSALKREVASLESEVASLRSGGKGTGEIDAETRSLIAGAQDHADAARKYLLERDIGGARAELEKSLQLMQQVGRDAGSTYSDALDTFQRTIQDTRTIFERLRQSVEKDSGETEGG